MEKKVIRKLTKTGRGSRQAIAQQLKDYVFPTLYGKTINSDEVLEGWRS